LVETKSDSVANIKSSGTSVLVLSDSFIQYQGSAVKLEHGSMNGATSKGMAAQIGGLKVVPAATAWTEFEVHDTDGAVRIIARILRQRSALASVWRAGLPLGPCCTSP
jgi:hypothetical protein